MCMGISWSRAPHISRYAGGVGERAWLQYHVRYNCGGKSPMLHTWIKQSCALVRLTRWQFICLVPIIKFRMYLKISSLSLLISEVVSI